MRKRIASLGLILLVSVTRVWSLPTNLENTQANSFLSNLTNGGYARMAVADVLEDFIPFWNMLPIEFAPLEEEFARFIQRETSRQTRRLVQRSIGNLGLSGPLSLVSYSSSPGGATARYSRARRPLRLRARVSRSRLGLSLNWAF